MLEEKKTATSDDMKSEIQRRLVEAEGWIRRRKEETNKCQSSANLYEERLGLLVKEGEYKRTTYIKSSYTKLNNNIKYFLIKKNNKR